MLRKTVRVAHELPYAKAFMNGYDLSEATR